MEQKSQPIFSSLLICAALIICAFIVGGELGNISISGGDGGSGGDTIIQAEKEYLADSEAREYLCIDYEIFSRLLARGDLDGTYVLLQGANLKEKEPPEVYSGTSDHVPLSTETTEPAEEYKIYVFSRAKLDEYMQKLIASGKTVTIPAE